MITVDNAVIMAAGTASRFAPLSYERPKALIEVRGEVLIERQIRQLRAAGIRDIYVVTGYRAADFNYLQERFGVILRHNADYNTRNNQASIHAVRDILKNSYVCSADNYFLQNPFAAKEEAAYYAAVYADGETKEWCLTMDETDRICGVQIGGRAAWYMLGHTFWDESFSRRFIEILEAEYALPETADKLWEEIYTAHLDELAMKIRRYEEDFIFEFDTLDELRTFDHTYIDDTRSAVLKEIAAAHGVTEGRIIDIRTIKGGGNEAIGCSYEIDGRRETYFYA
ncbi:MAG: NTP transferase domain-containing protein [Lachnospiraceae bacterium]|nr:NTP transferase domain-containing protein [Lachnospiraceae bacterium]MDY5742097.1 NTP transferase domain-containing protein [Lachnospiraceae bacterium]